MFLRLMFPGRAAMRLLSSSCFYDILKNKKYLFVNPHPKDESEKSGTPHFGMFSLHFFHCCHWLAVKSEPPTAQDYFQRGLNMRISLSSSLFGPRWRAGNQSDEDVHGKATDQTKMRKQNKAGSVCCGGHQEGIHLCSASQIPFFCSLKLNFILLWNNFNSLIKFWTIKKKILLYLFIYNFSSEPFFP